MGARFSAPIQTEFAAHPASYTVGTGSIAVVKRPERGVDHPPHLEVKLRKITLLPLLVFVACSRVNFTVDVGKVLDPCHKD
jgi:hypothetical protein